MLRKFFLIFVYFIPFTNIALADYQNSISLSLYQLEDNISSGDVEGQNISGTHYFSQVETAKGPWELVPFIQRTGYIQLGMTTYKDTRFAGGEKGTNYSFKAVFAQPGSSFVYGASYEKDETDIAGFIKLRSNSYGLSLGYFIGQYTLISTQMQRSKKPESYSFYEETDTETQRFNLRKIFLYENGTAINMSVDYSKETYASDEEFKTTSISGDFFFNSQLSVGAHYKEVKSNLWISSVDGNTTVIKSNYFINQSLQLSASYSEFKNNSIVLSYLGIKEKTLSLSGSYYF
ncbi:MAG: hypothetical protein OEY00_09150 [Gammaproteobacteria bacterium]|nr:hypothetical protein [Gammaproteobacteria bacterium]